MSQKFVPFGDDDEPQHPHRDMQPSDMSVGTEASVSQSESKSEAGSRLNLYDWNYNDGRQEEDDDMGSWAACWARWNKSMQKYVKTEMSNAKEYFEDVQLHLCTREGWEDIFEECKKNWKSGIAVSLVNLPLSISLAVAAKTHPVAGVVTCLWAGFFHALLAGSSFNIVGPTGALSGLLAHFSLMYGTDILPVLAFIAGVLCLIVWILHIERYVLYVPSSVLEGFTLGIAFIIALNQLNNMFGLMGLASHDGLIENVIESLAHIGDADVLSIFIALFTFGCLFTLGLKWGKIPWVILFTLAGILLGYLSTEADALGHKFLTLQSKYGDFGLAIIDVPHSIPAFNMDVIMAAASVAFVAILETFFCAKIADRMTGTTFNQKREAFAIGICNMFSGMAGGIPATAALARTAFNIKSGATSRLSGIINVIVVFAMSVGLLRYFKYLPLCVVAGIVINVAAKMIAYEHVSHIYHRDKQQFFILMLTAVVVVVEDPTAGIVVGMLVALLVYGDLISDGHSEVVIASRSKRGHTERDVRVLTSQPHPLAVTPDVNPKEKYHWSYTHGHDQVEPDEDRSSRRSSIPHEAVRAEALHGHDVPIIETLSNLVIYRIAGPLSFINADAHRDRLFHFCNDTVDVLVLSMRYNFFIDFDACNMLEEVNERFTKQNKRVYLSGLHPDVAKVLNHCPWFRDKARTNMVLPTYHYVYQYVDQGVGNKLLEAGEKRQDMPKALREARKRLGKKNKSGDKTKSAAAPQHERHGSEAPSVSESVGSNVELSPSPSPTNKSH